MECVSLNSLRVKSVMEGGGGTSMSGCVTNCDDSTLFHHLPRTPRVTVSSSRSDHVYDMPHTRFTGHHHLNSSNDGMVEVSDCPLILLTSTADASATASAFCPPVVSSTASSAITHSTSLHGLNLHHHLQQQQSHQHSVPDDDDDNERASPPPDVLQFVHLYECSWCCFCISSYVCQIRISSKIKGYITDKNSIKVVKPDSQKGDKKTNRLKSRYWFYSLVSLVLDAVFRADRGTFAVHMSRVGFLNVRKVSPIFMWRGKEEGSSSFFHFHFLLLVCSPFIHLVSDGQ